MSYAKTLIVGLAEGMGLDGLTFKDNVAGICFDELTLNLHIDPNTDEVSLFMCVGDILDNDAARLATYAMLLKANNFGKSTGGAILGIDENEHSVFINHTFSVAHMDTAYLERIVEGFLNLGEGFAADLRTLSERFKPHGAAPQETPLGGMRV